MAKVALITTKSILAKMVINYFLIFFGYYGFFDPENNRAFTILNKVNGKVMDAEN